MEGIIDGKSCELSGITAFVAQVFAKSVTGADPNAADSSRFSAFLMVASGVSVWDSVDFLISSNDLLG
jgi:hypothetical protein